MFRPRDPQSSLLTSSMLLPGGKRERLEPEEAHLCQETLHDSVLARRRRYQQTEAFRERYATRAGVEGTNSELKRKHGMGRLRVRGAKRVRLAVRLKALACNVKRMVGYLVDRAKAAARAAAAEAAAA